MVLGVRADLEHLKEMPAGADSAMPVLRASARRTRHPTQAALVGGRVRPTSRTQVAHATSPYRSHRLAAYMGKASRTRMKLAGWATPVTDEQVNRSRPFIMGPTRKRNGNQVQGL